jgi:hypothetical protein
MRRISMSLVALAVLGALLAPGVSQSVAVPAGSACALVTTPLDTDATGYYCSTTFSTYPILRWNIVGDAAWEVDILDQQGYQSFLSPNSADGDPPSGQIAGLTCNPCRIRLHITPFGPAVVGTVSLLPK